MEGKKERWREGESKERKDGGRKEGRNDRNERRRDGERKEGVVVCVEGGNERM